jgi:acyl-CoA reductase-like NAD-dependent aldehyde dehydrogenase
VDATDWGLTLTTESSPPAGAADERVAVRKTYKLFIGGAFPRSESGRTYLVSDVGGVVANVAQASRKDLRDAVVAARKAQPGWAGATAYNRGQVLYRVAEMLEGRRTQFAAEVASAEGITAIAADHQVSAAIDRWVWYAGWSDKLSQVLGASNPVAGPYFNFSVPEPSGVVGVIAPPASSLLGLVSVLAPVIVSGNTAVVIASSERPIPAVTLTEVLATSDLPGGVVNLLTGDVPELAPWMASHQDIDALDLAGAGELSAELERSAADTVKRVLRPEPTEPDWAYAPDMKRMTAFLETKTVWHPVGV